MTESTPTDDTNKVDTAKAVDPKATPTTETTPIFEETTAYLKDADEVDVTHFDEDDDPTKLAGDFVDEEGEGK